MSKYGYNPDEHFQTKVTLIDKDGFHKESDEVPSEVPSEESSNVLNLKQGIYLYHDKYDENCTNMVIIFDKENTPELFGDTYYSIYGTSVYFGDAIDDSELTIDPEMYSVFHNGAAIGIGFGNGYLTNNGDYIGDSIILHGRSDEGYNQELTEYAVEGNPVHVACVFSDISAEQLFVKQLHSTWHIINQ